MSRKPYATVVTANDLIEGDVVYLTAAQTWTRHLEQAHVLTDQTEAEVALAAAVARPAEVVGCYLAPVRQTPNGPQPAHFREEFRRRGPSNYAHGKQATSMNAA